MSSADLFCVYRGRHARGRPLRSVQKEEHGGILVDAFGQNEPLVLFTGTDLVDGLVNPGVVTGWATMRQIDLNIAMTPTLPTPRPESMPDTFSPALTMQLADGLVLRRTWRCRSRPQSSSKPETAAGALARVSAKCEFIFGYRPKGVRNDFLG